MICLDLLINFYESQKPINTILNTKSSTTKILRIVSYLYKDFAIDVKQEGLAVSSVAQDDPFPLTGMHRDHNAR